MPARLPIVAKLGECNTVDAASTQTLISVIYAIDGVAKVGTQMMCPVTVDAHSI